MRLYRLKFQFLCWPSMIVWVVGTYDLDNVERLARTKLPDTLANGQRPDIHARLVDIAVHYDPISVDANALREALR